MTDKEQEKHDWVINELTIFPTLDKFIEKVLDYDLEEKDE